MVIDQVSTNLLMVLADLHQGKNLGGADDGGIHACFTAVVQEDRIQRYSGGRG